MKMIDAERVLRRILKPEAEAHIVSRGIHAEALKGGPPARMTRLLDAARGGRRF